jgi:hypothetical protein
MGRRAKLADRPPPRQMGMGRWVDTPAERRADATGGPLPCQSAGSIKPGQSARSISGRPTQCPGLNFRYRPIAGPSLFGAAAEESERPLACAPFDARSVLRWWSGTRRLPRGHARRCAPACRTGRAPDQWSRIGPLSRTAPALTADTRNRRRRRWRGWIGGRLRRRRGRLRGACRDKRRWNQDGNQRGVTDFFGNVRHLFSPELCKSYNRQSNSES